LLITATFDEPMLEANAVKISLSGGATLTEADMTRVSETVYTYVLTVPNSDGDVTVTISNGTDLRSNEVVATPTAGQSFAIIPIVYGDVDEDGTVFAYDGALALQYSVGLDPIPTIDALPWENWRDTTANVDDIGEVTANDAAMILQYSIGKILAFDASTKKSVSLADVDIAVTDTGIVFYSSGDLIGLNISTENESNILGTPEFIAENFLSAMNINDSTYKLGICSSSSPEEGTALLKIPYTKTGTVSFDLVVNAVKSTVSVDVVTGIISFEQAGIKMYPNPVNDKLTIEGIETKAVVIIFNANGQHVITTQINTNIDEINVSELSSGMYIIKLTSDDKVLVKQFTKE